MHLRPFFARHFLILLAFLLAIAPSAFSSHNLAGQITAEQSDPNNNPNKYEITLTTYTDPAPAGVDRCQVSLEIFSVQIVSGSPVYTKLATLDDIPRANGPLMTNLPSDCTLPLGVPRNGIPVKGSIKENFYFIEFVFPGPGLYEIRYSDLARSAGIINLTKSEEQTFYLGTQLFITPPIVGNNNTLVLLNRPLDDACAGKVWTHNPGGFDKDGDSLAYYLAPVQEYEFNGTPPITANGFLYPDDPTFGIGHTFFMDPVTGVVTWDVPETLGVYNFSYIVEEWRDGTLLGNVRRDLSIVVIDCDNNPPVIETITDTCINAGDTLIFDYKAWDPDGVDSLYLELNNGSLGNNGPFGLADNPATLVGMIVDPVQMSNTPYFSIPVSTLNNGNGLPVDTIKGTVTWITLCDNIRKSPFQVDFYATDNKNYAAAPANTTLAANAAITIKVIPPPPEELIVIKGDRSIELIWSPSICSDKVEQYNVYRSVSTKELLQDSICCENTPDQLGFSLIATVQGWTNITYLDSLNDFDEIVGKEICYVVTAVYKDQTNPDLPILESCATNVACVELETDELFMTNDSVSVTSVTAGEMFISWSLPNIDEFYPAPYNYRLYRANNNGFPAIKIADLPFQDTTYFDTGLDTETRGYNYRVEVFDAEGMRVPTSEVNHIGSSIYLTTAGGNNAITLSWTEYVQWSNTEYEIFRSENGGAFLSLVTIPGTGASTHTYVDMSLNPNIEYCYFVRSTGSHNIPDIKPVLINDSQLSCSFARDEEPPCPPMVEAEGDCENKIYTVQITKDDPSCSGDTDFLTIKFGPTGVGPFREVLRLEYESFGVDTSITISGLQGSDFAGCYTVTATDTLGNESRVSAPACIDFCPSLIMANVFSPNGDGINDFLRPVQYQDVILKQIDIYDRWGRLMYQTTTNIEQLWDGSVAFSNKPAVEGVYYYYLRYEDLGISGNEVRELRGWVSLFR